MSSSLKSERFIKHLPAGATRLETLKKGQTFPDFESGGPIIYLLESGIAIIDLVNTDGQTNCLGCRRPYSLFNELPNTKRARPYTKQITALTDSTLIEIRRDHIPSIVEESTEVARALRNAVIQDTYSLEDQAALTARTTVRGRIPSVLLDLAEDSDQNIINVTQELIARIVGSTRVSVNRIIAEYREKGIVSPGAPLKINGTSGIQSLKDLARDGSQMSY